MMKNVQSNIPYLPYVFVMKFVPYVFENHIFQKNNYFNTPYNFVVGDM